MKLKVKCNKCNKEFNLDQTYIDRPNMVGFLGEYFELNCSICKNKSEYHANDIIAFDNYSTNLIGTVVGIAIIILVSLFMWNKGYISNLGLIIGCGIIAASNMTTLTSNTNAFNKYKIVRNPKSS